MLWLTVSLAGSETVGIGRGMFKRSLVAWCITVGLLLSGSSGALAADTPPAPPTTSPATPPTTSAASSSGGPVLLPQGPDSSPTPTKLVPVESPKAGTPVASSETQPKKGPAVTVPVTDAPPSVDPKEPKKAPKAGHIGKGGGKVKPVKGKQVDVPGGFVKVKLEDDASDTETPEVNVDQLAEEEANAMGGNKLAVRVDRSDAGVEDAPLEVAFNYDSFRDAIGGDYATRVKIVQFPACAGLKDCTDLPTDVPSVNDPITGVVKAKIRLKGKQGPSLGKSVLPMSTGNSSGGVFGVSSGTGGTAGQYSSTPLLQSSAWAVGQQSGAFTWNYPITVPPAAGPTPSVALSYNSQSVDGMTTETNNQGGMIAPGWDLSAGGFIERAYEPCPTNAAGGPDLCGIQNGVAWRGWTLNLNGHSSEILPTAAQGFIWKLRDDPGWYVIHRTGFPGVFGGGPGVGNATNDNDSEMFEVHSPDGMTYYFGSAPARNSVWAVPVRKYACLNVAEATCYQGWRFNLDRVVDPSGNSMVFSYAVEMNEYYSTNSEVMQLPKVAPNPAGSNMIDYARGGYVTRIDYGFIGSVAGQGPASVVFNYENRCTALNSTCDAIEPNTTNDASYPDIPTDLYCRYGLACQVNRAPSFFTTKTLRSIQTYANGAFADSWQLTHEFPLPETGMSARLWLRNIQRSTPINASISTQATLPSVRLSFEPYQATNLLPGGLNHPYGYENRGDAYPIKMRFYRITSIVNEFGGETLVTYDRPNGCDYNGLVGKNEDYVTYQRDCYLAWYVPPSGSPGWATMNKWLVAQIVEKSNVPGNDDVATSYQYLGAPAWRHPERNYTAAVIAPTIQASEFRGHGEVIVTVGAAGTTQSRTRYRYFLGMNGDTCGLWGVSYCVNGVRNVAVADAYPGPTTPVADDREFSGRLISSESLDAAGQFMEHVNHTYAHIYTTPLNVGTVVKALPPIWRVVENSTTTSRWYAPGNYFSNRRTWLDLNSNGNPTAIHEDNISQDGTNRCTTFKYRSSSVAFPSYAPWFIDQSVEDVRYSTSDCSGPWVSFTNRFYDGATTATYVDANGNPIGNIGAKGQVTMVYNWPGGPNPANVTHYEYDSLGRVTKQSVPMAIAGFTFNVPAAYTNIVYAPPSGLVTSITATSPIQQVTTQTIDPRWGAPTTIVDGGTGGTTRIAYDGLGRRDQVFLPDSATVPAYRFKYNMPPTGGLLTNGGASVTTYQNSRAPGSTAVSEILSTSYLDGLGRPRQSHSQRDDGGQIVSQTSYDSRGLAKLQIAPYGTGALSSPDTQPVGLQQTRTTYDEIGRPTATTTEATAAVPAVAAATTTISYPYWGTKVQPPTGLPTTTYYNPEGNVSRFVEQKYVGGVATDETTTYVYDANGNRAKMIDPKNNITTYTTDFFGRPLTVNDPDKGTSTTKYTLDGTGNSSTITMDATNHLVKTAFDQMGRPTLTEEVLTFNGVGIGPLEQYTYKTILGTPGFGQLDVTTSCEPFAGYAGPCNKPITTKIDTYDVRGRITSKTYGIPGAYTNGDPGSYTFTYEYNAANERTKVNYPAIVDQGTTVSPAEPVTTEYSSDGRLKRVTSPTQGYVLGTTYRTDGRISSRLMGASTAPAGLNRTFAYDGFGRLKTLGATWQNVVIQSDSFTYDTRSNIKSTTDNAPGPNNGQTQCYNYDEGNRLQQAWTTNVACGASPNYVAAGSSPYSVAFNYDSDGAMNAMIDSVAGATKTQTFDTVHKHAVATSGTDTFTYWGNGSMDSRTGTKWAYFYWDPENRLHQVLNTAGRSTYRYDTNGQRIVSETPQGTTLYLDGLIEIKTRRRDIGSRATFLADVNNPSATDRKADLIEVNANEIYVRISNGTFFSAPTLWATGPNAVNPVVGDFNGDGKSDLMFFNTNDVSVRLSTGASFAPPTIWSSTPVTSFKRAGDFNGDGKADLVEVPTTNVGATVRLSSGTGLAAGVAWSTETIPGGYQLGDVNGDGKKDLINPYGSTTIRVRLANSTGTGFLPSVSGGTSTGYPLFPFDVNADGKTDLMDLSPNTGTVRLSTTTGYAPAAAFATAVSFTYPANIVDYDGASGNDINGDGKPDLVSGTNVNGIAIYLGAGNGTSTLTPLAFAGSFYEGPTIAIKRYYMAGSTVIAQREPVSLGFQWLLSDRQGTTSLNVPDQNGTANITRQLYRPFGQQRGGDTMTATDHGFLGQIEDATGLTYLNNRYYDPTTARFISVDPLVDVTRDAYGYAGNNPISYSDPTGLEKGANGEARARCNYLQTCNPSISNPNDWGDSDWLRDYNQSNGDLGSVPSNQPLGMGWPRDAPQPPNAIGLTALSILVPPIGTALNVEGCLKGSVVACGATALHAAGASRAARAEAATGAAVPGTGSFKAGDLFETSFKAPAGNVQVLAEVEVNGSQLVLKDVAIYGENGSMVNQIGAKDLVALKNQVIQKATAEGFTSVRITGTRVAGSSSAAPGKAIDITIKTGA
jgi:RHS repeat-associated protein